MQDISANHVQPDSPVETNDKDPLPGGRAADPHAFDAQYSLRREATELDQLREDIFRARQEIAHQRSRADAAEIDAHHNRAQLRSLTLRFNAIASRLSSVENSTTWRATWPLRTALEPRKNFARLLKRALKVIWWCLTFQLLRKYRLWRLKRQPGGSLTDLPKDRAENSASRSDTALAEPSASAPVPSPPAGQVRANYPEIWFEQAWYSGDGDGTAGHDYEHFLSVGADEGRTPSALADYIMQTFGRGRKFSRAIFDALVEASSDWHAEIPAASVWLLVRLYVPQWHPDRNTPLESFLAYLREGIASDRRPGPLFESAVYRKRAAGSDLPVLKSGESAIRHWLKYGAAARIVPTERFDEEFYRSTYGSRIDPQIWLFAHFIMNGVFEGFLPDPAPAFYIAPNMLECTQFSLPPYYKLCHAADFDNAEDLVGEQASYRRMFASQAFLSSDSFRRAIADAQLIEPNVGDLDAGTELLLPPFNDFMAPLEAEMRNRIPGSHYGSILCVPWIRTGGADLVAGLLAAALQRLHPDEKILILRTDNPHFERGNWLPAQVDVVDISDVTTKISIQSAEILLRAIFRGLQPKRIFNVNSRLCWTTFRSYGKNLASTFRLYAYLFCWDQTKAGLRAGYPSEFFADTADSVSAFLTDTEYLKAELQQMYSLPEPASSRIVPLFTPAQTSLRHPSVAREVLEKRHGKSRQLVLWAGRLDRQKRFDLVQEIARLMPQVDFYCWGTALLDAPPDLHCLPANIKMQGSFESFDDLPLTEAGAWLYTARWDGMPTTLIELAARGVAIVASAVGGVPELIQADTGWPVPPDAPAAGYAAALQSALNNPAEAMARAERLQVKMAARYTQSSYDAALLSLLKRE